MAETVIKMVMLLIAGTTLGVLLLIMVYSIPVDRIFYNFSTSIEGIYRDSGLYPYIFDYDASITDIFTEFLMVKAAATPIPPTGENIFQIALRGYTINEKSVQHGLKFVEYIWNGEINTCDSYERYWHGYLVILKPLIFVFSYHDILFLNSVIQLLIMFGILWACGKTSGGKQLRVPFILIWILGQPISIMFCLDYSTCFYIYSLAALCLLLSDKAREKYLYFFMIVGMVTVYMDFLTWPLITLGVPLTVLIALDNKKSILKIVKTCGAWVFGYAGLWGMKWVLASVVLKENVIGDAMQEIALRSSSYSGDDKRWIVSFPQVVLKNLSVFEKKTYVLLGVLIFIVLLYYIVKGRKCLTLGNTIPYLLIAALPLGWYLITKNHSYMHYFMAWRIQLITVFAICGGIFSLDGKTACQ